MDGTNQAKDKSTTQSETNIEELLDSEGSDYCPSEHEASASEFFDNDNNHCDAADEISDGHVTGSVLESLGYHPTNIGYNSDDGDSDSDSDDDVESLHSLSSENSGSRKTNRFPEFNTELDMKTPVLKNKLLFASKEILKEAVRQYGRVQRFNMSFKKNDKKRLQAVCSKGNCSWVLWASRLHPKDCDDDTWQIKTLFNEHSCQRGIPNQKLMSSHILAAVKIDANDCIYPIAVAAVEAETHDSWCWFLQLLSEDLGIVNSHHVTFMSDKQKMIIDARDKLILTIMEIIRTKMMQRISKKAEAAQKCWPSHAGALRYEVAFGPSDQHVVDLEAGVCSCRKWDLIGIPCAHAISAMLSIQRRPENYVDSCYHRTTQINLYSNYIFPIRGANQWEQVPKMESLPILPPIQRRSTGHNIRSCRGQVRGTSRLNTPLSSVTPAPSPEPSSSTVAPPITAPPTFSTVVPPTTTPLTRIIPKLPFKRPAQTIQVPSHSTPTKQRRKIKVAAGMQFSQVQPTQHQPTPYQVVRWMMQSTPCDNVLPNSQESTGNFKPKNN
ncbi:hypothetical protein V6N13_075215 [Hibiscus sabdariffa]